MTAAAPTPDRPEGGEAEALERVEVFIKTVSGLNEMTVVRGIRKAIAGEETTFEHEVRLKVYGEWCGHPGVPKHYPAGYGTCEDCAATLDAERGDQA